MPLYSGVANLSAKWRRSKKQLKWLDMNDLGEPSSRKRSTTLQIKPKKTARSLRHYNYRLPKGNWKKSWTELKPLIDIFQEKSWITIVAEIAGFNRETLKINVKDQKLTLSAKAKDRRYYKSLNLPKVVIPSIVHTTYKNGVLEIKLKKATKEETIHKQTG